MGNFEKLVVLTILFLSAIVLAVSLNDEEAKPEDPLAVASEETSGTIGPMPAPGTAPEARGTLTGPLRAGDTGAAPLLDARVGAGAESPSRGTLEPRAEGSQAAAPEATPAPKGERGDGRARILREESGLETASGMDDFRVYRVASGDTWSGLADRFYRDSRYMGLLRSANEELDVLKEGEAILVPVFDFTQEAGQRAPHQPRSAPVGTVVVGAAVPGGVYVVRDGDNLTSISKAVFGTVKRWEDIYRENRDVLQDPDWLQVGMKLKLPR
jgi:nucleoid-associated protein YgaU